jgi:hypothetical protein
MARTRSRVASAIGTTVGVRLRTRETVLCERPVARAISRMVTRPTRPDPSPVARRLREVSRRFAPANDASLARSGPICGEIRHTTGCIRSHDRRPCTMLKHSRVLCRSSLVVQADPAHRGQAPMRVVRLHAPWDLCLMRRRPRRSVRRGILDRSSNADIGALMLAYGGAGTPPPAPARSPRRGRPVVDKLVGHLNATSKATA